MNAHELFQAGQITAAIQSLTARVKALPNDLAARSLLAELLCIQGDLERADKQLTILADQDAKNAYTLAILRQLIRAELARQETRKAGRVPEIFNKPDAYVKKQLQALTEWRAGNGRQTVNLLKQASQKLKPLRGRLNQQPFTDIRDLDDLCQHHLEVLTFNGAYYWLPLQDIKSIEFSPAKRPLDLIWRQTHIILNDERSLDAVIPAIYAHPESETDERIRLGRMTDWQTETHSPTLGLGLRMFLIGETAVRIHDIHTLSLEQVDAG